MRPSWPTEITPKVLSADGPKGLSDAAEIDVDEVLADPSWRWLKVFLPANFEHGYIASWKGGEVGPWDASRGSGMDAEVDARPS